MALSLFVGSLLSRSQQFRFRSPACVTVAIYPLLAVARRHARQVAAILCAQNVWMPMLSLMQGIFKVLGKGELPDQPVVVKAKFFSKLAEKKIKAVGGACILVA
uniref:Large ribosomal subunit protein uL15/eL18 domain-containing protein n=1 Tax=Chrysotila carterae TaxID=13221 RepID=A0A7S4EVA0_CHRCT|mmetsp:Transcript_27388/g.57638  ORF Transcript_27388/g.57638 Transcript_27388/m.57638 type:complete len:104 (-) Transcript_27388:354-665(-)